MKLLQVSFKVPVYEWPESRLTAENIIRKMFRLGEEVLDDFDETIFDLTVEEVTEEGNKEIPLLGMPDHI